VRVTAIGVGSGKVDFSTAAAAEPASCELREVKICEWDGCGRTFYRVKNSGTVYCDHCRARLRAKAAARRAQTKVNQRGN
jgi:hypothetical protein